MCFQPVLNCLAFSSSVHLASPCCCRDLKPSCHRLRGQQGKCCSHRCHRRTPSLNSGPPVQLCIIAPVVIFPRRVKIILSFYSSATPLISPPLSDSMTPWIISRIRWRIWFTTFIRQNCRNIVDRDRGLSLSYGRLYNDIVKMG